MFVTEPGLEPFVVAEARELLPDARLVGDVPELRGLVSIDTAHAVVPDRFQTVQHVAVLRLSAELGSLDELASAAAEAEIPELAAAESFRVTAHLRGQHAYQSHTAAGKVGYVLQQRYGTRVDLENFALDIRLDLQDRHMLLSIQLTRSPIGNRILRAQPLRGAVKAPIAAAMVRLGGGHRGRHRMLDPMCGGGTIPVQAKLMNDELEVAASDWDDETVAVARQTFRNHGLDVDLRCVDARRLPEAWKESFDLVIVNPPFGQRLGRKLSLSRFYRQVLESLIGACDGHGRIVVWTPRLRSFEKAYRGLPLELVGQVAVETGGMEPRMHLLELR